tara:strand:- start:265 stop:468 length:204 start_codon:yes stop_codon:yes gene_type:complete
MSGYCTDSKSRSAKEKEETRTILMSTFTDAYKLGKPSLDGPNDLRPEVKTSIIIEKETKTKKTTKKK